MRIAYLDTSGLAAVLLSEPGATELGLEKYDSVWASNLLEAELLSVIRREGMTVSRADWLHHLQWVLPDRPLSLELEQVYSHGPIRGADAWHLACALFLSPRAEVVFVSLDSRQRDLARLLGFEVAPPPA